MREATPVVETQMLIRKPVAEVFEAFVDPAVTTRFWFTKSSGRLEPGKQVTWEWEMYGASAPVVVNAVETNARILIDWGEPATSVEWRFAPRGADATLVQISQRGFGGSGADMAAAALDAMGGFSLVLAGAKAWLEHGLQLNLVADRAPDAHVTPARSEESGGG